MDILPLIPEINALLPSDQTGNRTQRSPLPFTAGQILQATVRSQEGPTLFTLNMGGQELAVKSSTSLQIGQPLSIKITALSPQLQLQVVDTAPADQRISAALQAMVNQGKAFSQISALADAVSHSSQQISLRSQDVLQQMSGNLSVISAENSQLGKMIEQIASTFLTSAPASGAEPASNGFATVGQLLQQLAEFSDLSPKLRDNIANLADSFLRATGFFETAESESVSPPLLSTSAAREASEGTELQQQMSQINPSIQTLLQPIAELLGQHLWHSENHLVEQLLKILIQTGTESENAQQATFDGRQLRQTLQNMGMNLEQLLAQGDMQQAAGTLKFALLELSNLPTVNQSQLQTIDEVIGSIQSSQLMQIRLSHESIFFLPLPFPFLESGFLLIENEKQREPSQQTRKKQDVIDEDIGIYLQLEGLGNLRINIRQENNQISLTFYSQDAERAQFIGEHREELQKILTTGTLSSARFLTGAKEPIKTLIEKILHAPTGMVNTLA